MRKICSKCKVELEASTDNFHKAKLGKYGLTAVCKPCMRQHYLSTGGVNRTRFYKDVKYCRDCKLYKPRDDFHFASKKQNARKVLCKTCRSAEWIREHPNSIRRRTPEDRRQRAMAVKRNWYHRHSSQNPERFRKYVIDRRARLAAAEGTYTKQEWLDRLVAYRYKCFYCLVELTTKSATKDHLVALSKGGSNWISNIVPACHSCNSGKCDRDFREYLRYKNPEYAK